MERQITVHALSNHPTAAWKEISETQEIIQINAKIPSEPVQWDNLRFVCMSDTHSATKDITFEIPPGDVFIHAGDFTTSGRRHEVIEFNEWLGTLPHKHKVVIAGNHELTFDSKFSKVFKKKDSIFIVNERVKSTKNDIIEVKSENMKQYLTNCVYLEDSYVDICDIRLYGSPWQPKYRGWAFNLSRGEQCLAAWNKIPADTDILITHTPPLGHGDLTYSGMRTGCVELLTTVQQRVKPKYHVFGHIHEGYGVSSDGQTIFINASTCDSKYAPINLPVVFDVPLPQEYIKKIHKWCNMCSII